MRCTHPWPRPCEKKRRKKTMVCSRFETWLGPATRCCDQVLRPGAATRCWDPIASPHLESRCCAILYHFTNWPRRAAGRPCGSRARPFWPASCTLAKRRLPPPPPPPPPQVRQHTLLLLVCTLRTGFTERVVAGRRRTKQSRGATPNRRF